MRGVEEEEEFGFEDEELLERVKAKIGFMVRTLLQAKAAVTEQIIFISSENYLRKVARDM